MRRGRSTKKPWTDRTLARLCLKNSRRLQDAAQLLAGGRHFGPGFHLLAAAIEEQTKGIVYGLWAGKLARKGARDEGGSLTFKSTFVRASRTSHQDRFVLFADLIFLYELLYHIRNQLGVDWTTPSEARDAVKTIIRAITGKDTELASRLDATGSLAWAAKAHYGAVPIYRELRDAGVYIDFDGTHLTGPGDIDRIEFEVLRDGLEWIRALWAPMARPGSQTSPYAILLTGLLSFVRSKKRFRIPRPWSKDLKTKWGFTDTYWIDVAIGLLRESPLSESALRPNRR